MVIFRKLLFFLNLILLIIIIFFPQTAKAEIATTRDWIGLFPLNATGYGKTDTVANCPALDPINERCWLYTSSCTQTTSTTPRLAMDGLGGNPVACTFNFNPNLTSGSYVFRLMANDGITLEALLTTSRTMYSGSVSPAPVVASGKLYRITGDLTLNSNLKVEETGVVFIDGDLYINTNQTNNTATKGVVFVVGGTIFIDRDVETINAFLISYSGFCSAYDYGGTEGCVDYATAAQQKRLTINGSVIYLNPTNSPQFVRKFADPVTSNEPAEIINYDPKYLVIMKDIFSRDLKIWREIQ